MILCSLPSFCRDRAFEGLCVFPSFVSYLALGLGLEAEVA